LAAYGITDKRGFKTVPSAGATRIACG